MIGSIFSTQPMSISGVQRAHIRCTQSPVFVGFIAPPVFGHNTHFGEISNEQVLHDHDSDGRMLEFK